MEPDSEAEADALSSRVVRSGKALEGSCSGEESLEGQGQETRSDQKSLKLEAALTTERHEWGWGRAGGFHRVRGKG